MAYENRLDKDAAFIAQENVSLYYVLWKHHFKVTEGITLPELRAGLAESTDYIMFVRFVAFDRILREGNLMTLNAKQTQKGYGSKGYRDGYRVNLTRLRDEAKTCVLMRSFSVYGSFAVPELPIFAV
jgi:hypothetical protein